mmetsp:Transcript_4338/g.6476  ORF Transcript_4338/g.6476 Transcript_4338/m.6476 type:complete len:97 (-) Transcript_4338:267-557(-)|eukprot:CAMPEP_0201540910 /NCGR_PEP_ID=MMETSP0161_2-20130828/71195_1 /ASSEMBLY_ACC=CAM_ASM_000251 /TAXON_ID=180227 /ORGANISM="Neoparamoeba aestuarina, Strain SoJaBio B1-5/56/2" /LENGTH=96 /DNA_ID=CAMNT_0047948411 /DNA_START=424 /DNA_END=714 /DNA_ORIENTATION=+
MEGVVMAGADVAGVAEVGVMVVVFFLVLVGEVGEAQPLGADAVGTIFVLIDVIVCAFLTPAGEVGGEEGCSGDSESVGVDDNAADGLVGCAVSMPP